MLEVHKIDTNYVDSLVLFEEERYFVSSTAALKVLAYLSGWERYFQFLVLVPRPFRDIVYRLVANNRYKWFGRREKCMIPTPELIDRFLPDRSQ